MFPEIPSVLRQKCRLQPERSLLVGVSGGADSLCLLHLLHSAGYRLIVAHFNHRLRPQAEEDARFVAQIAERFALPYVEGEADVRAYARENRLSLEDAARQLRYRFLFAKAAEWEAQAVAVGHTASDQVETMLMHFLRGSGLKGLSGMDYISYLKAFSPDIPLVRPLLGIWREETRLYCALHGLEPRADPSNRSRRFLRNRIRHELLPLLETYNPRLREGLWRMGEILRGDYQILMEAVEQHWREVLIEQGEGFVALDEVALKQRAPAWQRHLLRRAVEEIFATPREVPFHLLERALRFVEEPQQVSEPLSATLMLHREEGVLYVLTPQARLPQRWPQMPAEGLTLEVPIPGEVTLDGGWQLTTARLESAETIWSQVKENTNPYQAWLDFSAITLPLVLRTPRPGDRFAPLGMNGHTVKLSDFFINNKVSLRARARWPLLCSGETIVWVPGYRLSEEVRLTPQSRAVLYVSLSRS